VRDMNSATKDLHGSISKLSKACVFCAASGCVAVACRPSCPPLYGTRHTFMYAMSAACCRCSHTHIRTRITPRVRRWTRPWTCSRTSAGACATCSLTSSCSTRCGRVHALVCLWSLRARRPQHAALRRAACPGRVLTHRRPLPQTHTDTHCTLGTTPGHRGALVPRGPLCAGRPVCGGGGGAARRRAQGALHGAALGAAAGACARALAGVRARLCMWALRAVPLAELATSDTTCACRAVPWTRATRAPHRETDTAAQPGPRARVGARAPRAAVARRHAQRL
jgi:hypothetical protein